MSKVTKAIKARKRQQNALHWRRVRGWAKSRRTKKHHRCGRNCRWLPKKYLRGQVNKAEHYHHNGN